MGNVHWELMGILIHVSRNLEREEGYCRACKNFKGGFCLEHECTHTPQKLKKDASSPVHFVAVFAASSQHYPSASRNYVHGGDQIG